MFCVADAPSIALYRYWNIKIYIDIVAVRLMCLIPLGVNDTFSSLHLCVWKRLNIKSATCLLRSFRVFERRELEQPIQAPE